MPYSCVHAMPDVSNDLHDMLHGNDTKFAGWRTCGVRHLRCITSGRPAALHQPTKCNFVMLAFQAMSAASRANLSKKNRCTQTGFCKVTGRVDEVPTCGEQKRILFKQFVIFGQAKESTDSNQLIGGWQALQRSKESMAVALLMTQTA